MHDDDTAAADAKGVNPEWGMSESKLAALKLNFSREHYIVDVANAFEKSTCVWCAVHCSTPRVFSCDTIHTHTHIADIPSGTLEQMVIWKCLQQPQTARCTCCQQQMTQLALAPTSMPPCRHEAYYLMSELDDH